MILSTTHTVPSREIAEIVGLVRGSTVRARNVGRDIRHYLPDYPQKKGKEG